MRKLIRCLLPLLALLAVLSASFAGINNPGGGTASYQGFVATGGRLLTNTTASFNQANSRSEHVATEALTSIKICLSNFTVDSGDHDIGVGAATTATLAVEYPANNFTPSVTFGGSTPGTIPDVGTLCSDNTSVSIPKGSTFWVREYDTNPNGLIYLSNQTTGSAEQFVAAVSGLSDQTRTPGPLTGGTSQSWVKPPLAIIGQTINRSVLIIGDSRTVNTSSALAAGMIEPSLAAAGVPFVNLSYPGERAELWISNATARNAMLPYGSQLINALGLNDVTFSRTPAQIVGDLQTINALSSAKYKYNTTIPPDTISSNGFVSPNDQVVVVSVTAFNNLVRAGFAGQNGFYEIADVAMISRNSDSWKVTTVGADNPPFTLEGVHLTPSGNKLILDSGVIVPAAYPFLLKRDLDPASNDNDPMWLEKAA